MGVGDEPAEGAVNFAILFESGNDCVISSSEIAVLIFESGEDLLNFFNFFLH